MLAHVVQQVEKSAALLERSNKAVSQVRGLRSGDRVYTPLIVSGEFDQGQAPSATLVFNVPSDADFWAYRLLLYPYCKVIDPVNGTPDEIVYRSTSFSGEAYSTGALNPALFYTDFSTLVDAVFAFILDGKELQNVDIPAAAAYTSGVGKWCTYPLAASAPISGWAGASQTPAGMVFDIPLFLPRGKSLSLRVTPTFLAQRTIVETATIGGVPDTEIIRKHKYKIVAVLEGEKKVAAFR